MIERDYLLWYSLDKKLVQEDGRPFQFKYYGADQLANKERYEEIGKVGIK